MQYSMQVYVPEMSLTSSYPKQRWEIERELGVTDKDTSKPLLLKLIEAVKYGTSQDTGYQPKKNEVDSFNGRNLTKSE